MIIDPKFVELTALSSLEWFYKADAVAKQIYC